MDAKFLSPFVEAVFEILPQFGVQNLQKGSMRLKNSQAQMQAVTAMVGLSKQVRGNVAYSMSESTAKSIVSSMMGGMPVNDLDAMAQSAISELANMLAANTVTKFVSMGLIADIAPPTLVVGDNVLVKLGPEKTLAIDILTQMGTIEVNVGIEVP